MGGIELTNITKGKGLARLEAKLKKLMDPKLYALEKYGDEGVAALSSATQEDTGLTAGSWRYETFREGSVYGIRWCNSHMAGNTPVVILLQYGHGTGTGGYVVGHDFINPVMKPLFERIKDDVRKAVSSA